MADEAFLACPLFTSCCAAWFLTGHGTVPVHSQGRVGDPWCRAWKAVLQDLNFILKQVNSGVQCLFFSFQKTLTSIFI